MKKTLEQGSSPEKGTQGMQTTQNIQNARNAPSTQSAPSAPNAPSKFSTPSAQSTHAAHTATTKGLVGQKVWMGHPQKDNPDAAKKVGRVRACVFHPTELRFVGFLVKRPDIAWMFHRQDMFVAFNGFSVIDGDIVVHDDAQATDRGACKALGINLDTCVLWVGLSVMCKDGTTFGVVQSVTYDTRTGKIISLDVSQGATADTLLGHRVIPARAIRGFHRGMGTQLYMADDDDQSALGAILVDDSVKELQVEGGVAETAGAATAKATDTVQKTYKRVVKKAKPTVDQATKAAGEAVTKGAYVTGRQVGRASGMFGRFAEEFKKGMNGEDD